MAAPLYLCAPRMQLCAGNIPAQSCHQGRSIPAVHRGIVRPLHNEAADSPAVRVRVQLTGHARNNM